MTASVAGMPDPGTAGASRPAALRVRLEVRDPLAAAGLRHWLRAADGTHPVRGDEACDVAVLGAGATPVSWLRRAVATLRAGSGATRVVVLADAPVTAAELGCEAVVPRAGLTCETLLSAVRAACGCPAAACGCAPQTVAAAPATDGDERAATVLAMLAEGHDLAEIAARLFYSERTVKNVLYGYLGQVGARNRVHAVAHAIRAGLV